MSVAQQGLPPAPALQLRAATKTFLGTTAVRDVSLEVYPGEVFCFLGHNGAGKSTLVKILSGVHQLTSGELVVDGRTVVFHGPQDAREMGIATVHQDVGTIPLMSVARNFFLGAEPTRGWGPVRLLDMKTASRIAVEEIRSLGIARVAPEQTVGTLSGGERQALAIARAVYFGARVLILDEPTSNLGVRETRSVLKLIETVRQRGVAVIVVTHNIHEATAIGDQFAVLIHGALAALFRRDQKSPEEIVNLMAGGREFEDLELEVGDGDGTDE